MIKRFLVLSVALHLMLAAAFALHPPEPVVRLEVPALDVAFASAVPRPASRHPARATPPSVLTPVSRAPASLKSDDQAEVSPRGALETAATAAPDVVTNSDVGETRRTNHLLSLVRAAVDHHFVYPPLARKRGWQGTVHVGLRLETSGHLRTLRLVRSSGYAILDRDALQTLERIGSIPQARQWLDGRPYETELTVMYRLVGS